MDGDFNFNSDTLSFATHSHNTRKKSADFRTFVVCKKVAKCVIASKMLSLVGWFFNLFNLADCRAWTCRRCCRKSTQSSTYQSINRPMVFTSSLSIEFLIRKEGYDTLVIGFHQVSVNWGWMGSDLMHN